MGRRSTFQSAEQWRHCVKGKMNGLWSWPTGARWEYRPAWRPVYSNRVNFTRIASIFSNTQGGFNLRRQQFIFAGTKTIHCVRLHYVRFAHWTSTGLPSRTSYHPALCFSSSVIFLLVDACVGLNWLLVSFLSHVNKNIIHSFINWCQHSFVW